MVAGAYTATYTPGANGNVGGGAGAVSLGMTEKGYNLRWRFFKDKVDATDTYGQGTLIENFYQGLRMWIGGVFKEYIDATIQVVSPYNAFRTAGARKFDLGIIGLADSTVAGSLILSSTAGTPAAAAPATLTVTNAIMDEDQVEMLFGPTHRTAAFNMAVIPFAGSTPTGVRFFSTT